MGWQGVCGQRMALLDQNVRDVHIRIIGGVAQIYGVGDSLTLPTEKSTRNVKQKGKEIKKKEKKRGNWQCLTTVSGRNGMARKNAADRKLIHAFLWTFKGTRFRNITAGNMH